jgi:hypothetical protein
MVQTHSELIKTCNQYNSLFQENELSLLQKAYTTPHFIALSIRFPGKTVIVYIGRGSQYQGIYLAEKMPPSHLRIQDRFLDYIRKHLVGSRISRFTPHSDEMQFLFEFKKEGNAKKIYLGWSDRHLYFDHKEFDKKIRFLAPKELESNRKPWAIEEYLEKKNLDHEKKIVQKKREKFLLKKMENIKNDLERSLKWKDIEADLIGEKIDLDANEVVLYGEKIKLASARNPWQKKDLIFKKIKKLKKGNGLLSIRFEETKLELERAKAGKVEFEITKEPAIQVCWPSNENKKNVGESLKNIKSIKILNIEGIIGLDSSGNDQIRQGVDKEYYWFHLENLKGAHCVLKTNDINQLTVNEISALASLLRDLSHLDILEIPILFTQLKNVKGIKGERGKVLVKKAKHLRCNYIHWKEIITI